LRFENQGIAIWYATSDAPAPDGTVETFPGDARAVLSITVGVAPQDPSNIVQVRYRVNGGTPATADAAFLRADGTRRAQYFRVWLPQLHPGDQVEYTATCHCVGRQVPAPAQAAGYLSSFKISTENMSPVSGPTAATGPGAGGDGRSPGATQAVQGLRAGIPAAPSVPNASQLSALAQPQVLYAPTSRSAGDPVVTERLNQRLGDEARRVMGRMSPALQRAVQAAQPGIQWSSIAGQRISDTATALLAEAGKDPQLAAEASQVHGRVAATATPTVADALCVDAPLRDNPALHEIATRGVIMELARLADLGDQATQAVVENSQAVASGGPGALDELVAQGKLSHDNASAMDANLELAKLTDDNVPLIRALRAAGASEPASLAGWTREHWQQLLADQQIPIPAGETPSTYADAIVHNLETTYPTHTVIAHAGDNQVAALFARNPNLDLRRINLVGSQPARLDWTGIPTAARPAVMQEMRSQQRLIALADDTAVRLTLKQTGHDSAIAVASKTEEEFIRASGLDEGQARLTYARAQETALSVASHYGAVRDLLKDGFKNLAVSNVSPLVDDLRQIDGLSDLFGPQDFCDCDECHSVLSPAAYFVDLMHFVESNVSRHVFIDTSQTQHPLYLKRRRPDLWSLQLTCENTHTLIPYLTIVNEVLEAYLGDVVGGDIYRKLSDPADKVSFRVPFSLPFAELSLYLGHFGLAAADIYRILGYPDSTEWRARLGLAPDEATVIATPDPDGVVGRLGSPASLDDYPLLEEQVAPAKPEQEDPGDAGHRPSADRAFLRSTGLQRDQLDSVLASRFNPDLAAVTVTSTAADPGELQNFAEVLKNLTATRVDFIHRFIRLWRATRWQIPELDLVLVAARDAGLIGPDIDDTAVQLIGRLTEIQAALHLGAEELCALVGQLPVSAAFPRQPYLEDRRLYERLFDLVTLFGPVDKSTDPQIPGRELAQSFTYHHYSLNTVNPADTVIDPKTPLLVGSLGISETDLLQLLALLKDQVPFDTSGNCTLDRRRLSLLYRHVRIARALNLRTEDFIQALQLIFEPSRVVLTTLDQIEQLMAFTTWLRTSPLSIVELRFILAGAETGPATYTNTSATIIQLVQQVQATPDTSRPDALCGRLAAIFNLTAARLDDTLAFIVSDLSSPAIQTALAATFTGGAPDKPADLAALLDLVHQLERVATLFSRLKLDDATVSYLRRQPGSLGIADIKALTLHDVQSIGFYRALAVTSDNATGLVQTVLDDYLSTGSLPGDSRARLASLWQVDHSLIDSLCAVMALPAHTIDALSRLRDALSTCITLGINGYSLKKLGDDTSFATLTDARDVAVGAFSAKYPDEAARAQMLQPYEDQINTIKRDALCDYILARRSDLKFRDHNEIYDFFLLDVDTGGCFRTSRVVSAISSVQLYVQRCLLNLEQTNPLPNPAIPAAYVDPTCIPAAEWEWRKNYRVWEANRKVFLYPESYLDPDLLDIKTPLLADLEDDLLQQKITAESASEAYQRYLTQFSELAHLRIAGTYYRAETSTYYFFGRTQQDPPVYYWRTWDGITWSAWQKIDLAIDAPAVAAEFHLGRLYLFWVDGKTKDHTSIKDGNSQLEYYEVTISLLYSTLNANGKWLPPQKLGSLHPLLSEVIPASQATAGGFLGTLAGTIITPPTVTRYNNRIYTDDALHAMELSKTYRNVYPKSIQDSLILRYYNNYLSGPAYFDRRLDLFHNKLRTSEYALPGLPPTPAVVLYSSGQSARLGLATSALPTEAEFDIALEQTDITPMTLAFPSGLFGPGQSPRGPVGPAQPRPPSHSYLTTSFAYNPFTKDQDHRDYVLNLVHNRYPESVLSVGDQDYLIHETQRAPMLVGIFHPPGTGITAIGTFHPSGAGTSPGITVHPPGTGITAIGTFHPSGTSTSPGTTIHPATPVAARAALVAPATAGAALHPAQMVGSQLRAVSPAVPATAARAQARQLTSTLLGGRFFTGMTPSQKQLVRLSTSLADDLGCILMEDGLEELLSLRTQQQCEKPVPFTITNLAELQYPADDAEHLNFKGAFGNYYRELYLHIPWVIARHLRADGRFEDALWWYRRVFDPTASESPQDHPAHAADRNWRYIEFRDWTVPKLKEILTDNAAINAYKSDPFNPHAIARLRPSAFQKAIVMDTVDTLIDWGDALFAQDTMESVTEAGMLYNLASEILGRKPARLGKCHTVSDDDLTYEKLGPTVDKGSEFLLLLENWALADHADSAQPDSEGNGTGVAAQAAPQPLTAGSSASSAPLPQLRPRVQRYAAVAAMRRQTAAVVAGLAEPSMSPPASRQPAIPLMIQSTLAFCVPPNQVLLSYWDRVEDRLFKIRNCMNISGARRQLALFQPPLEPMDLVRARAAGLSLDEALAALEAPVPPYRFTYLIDRARQAAQIAQSFGASLLSALEKKDVEELTLLRSLHERAVLRATKDVKTQHVQEAQHQCQALAEAEANVQNRIDYYSSRISEGLTGWETAEQVTRHGATALRIVASVPHLISAIAFLIPQVGSPFAMKYGGKETGDSARGYALWSESMAGVLEAVAGSAGLEASWQRRDQEWHQQLLLAQQELKQVEQQRLAADIGTTIATKELDIHQTTMDQADELDEFYKDKFTGLGLYNYLATTLTRLHHEAYNVADDLARMAQRAYQFERDDDTVFVAPDNWQFDRAGLLAGERLTLQLQQLENAYLARNTRQFEITQSFSLVPADPGALLNLRETGSCEFTLPEILFDLAYPGQYKRILSGVRLTIPCVAGPYTNVSAKLTLQESKVRKTPTTDPSALVTLPPQLTPSIAASTGNNDSGQFEFSFRDERYLPFEGAGAISTWRLDLPSRLRLFDYATIPDVILHLSYRALDDGAFREAVESGLVDTLTTYAATAGMHRLFSLRHEFPNAFYQLLHPADAAQETHITLGREHFPYFLSDQNLTITSVSLFIQSQEANLADTTGLTLSLNSSPTTTWTTPPNTNLRSADIPVSGPALAEWAVKVTAGHLDPDAVSDLLLLFKYTVT
jgi:uncharacterized protein YgfB (UPF0149 family)